MNQPPHNDPNFYDEQTEAFSYQPPQIQQPPTQKLGLWTRYRSAKKSVQWGIGCGVIIVVLLTCGVCASAANAAMKIPHSQATQTPSAGSTPAEPSPIATPTETPSPTATPSPTPTSKKTPTPRPTLPIPIPTITIPGINSNPELNVNMPTS